VAATDYFFEEEQFCVLYLNAKWDDKRKVTLVALIVLASLQRIQQLTEFVILDMPTVVTTRIYLPWDVRLCTWYIGIHVSGRILPSSTWCRVCFFLSCKTLYLVSEPSVFYNWHIPVLSKFHAVSTAEITRWPSVSIAYSSDWNRSGTEGL
jgi:hypothetical protein